MVTASIPEVKASVIMINYDETIDTIRITPAPGLSFFFFTLSILVFPF